MFFKTSDIKDFANFTRKHMDCRLQHSGFPEKIGKFLSTTFYRTPPVAASVLINVTNILIDFHFYIFLMRVCWIAHLAHPRTYACYPSLICALPAWPIIHTRLTHLRAYAHLHSSISALRAFFLSCYNLNMQDSMVMFTFSVFDQKYPVWVNLVQKIKIVSLSRNLLPVLIWICRSQW